MSTSIDLRTSPAGAPRTVFHAAWILPALILSQFAFLGVIPVTLIVVSTVRRVKSRTLRSIAGIVAGFYASAFVMWAVNPNRAPSLSRDMKPVLAAIICASSVCLAIAVFKQRRHASPRA